MFLKLTMLGMTRCSNLFRPTFPVRFNHSMTFDRVRGSVCVMYGHAILLLYTGLHKLQTSVVAARVVERLVIV